MSAARLPPLPFASTLPSAARSTPRSLRRTRRSRPRPASCAVNTKLLSTFAICPLPSVAEVDARDRRRSSNTGRIRSTTAASPPTITSSFLRQLRWPPPLTGASTRSTPRSAAVRRSAGTCRDGRSSESRSRLGHPSPRAHRRRRSTTSSTSASCTTQMPTTSLLDAELRRRGRDAAAVSANGFEGLGPARPDRERKAGVDDSTRHRRTLTSQADEPRSDHV